MIAPIDAHAHLWDRRLLDYRWLEDEPDLPAAFLPADLTATAPEVAEFIFVQADCAPDQGLAEAVWAQAVAGESGLAGIVAFAPLDSNRASESLERLAQLPRVVGVRRLLQSERITFFEQPALDAGLRLLSAHGFTFDACVRWYQLPHLTDVVHRHDDVTFVLDHLGKPPIGDPDALYVWRSFLQALADAPNVVVKLSGLPAEATATTAAHELVDLIRIGYDAFGPERSMVGSDWPVSAVTGLGRAEWFEMVRNAVGGTPAEWAKVARGTATRVYRLDCSSDSGVAASRTLVDEMLGR